MFTKADAEAYFLAEKQMCLLILIVGIIAIVAGIILIAFIKTPMYKGMGIAILAIGILQSVVGYTVYARSDAQRKDIVYKMDLNPGAITGEEIPRMEKVMKNFTIYRIAEVILLIVAIVLIVMHRNNPPKQWLYGVSIGIAIQVAILLIGDSIAAKRGASYLNGLQTWISAMK
ncbi:MAG TPA: hypothetical protein VLC98_10500 [Phnomibacter sp.]|nr:hypothetical protein [Phnomibacter sp.]